MPDDPGKETDKKVPHWTYGVLIALWTGLVYVLFFVNLVKDFLSGGGGR